MLSFERYKAEIMAEFSKEELFDFVMSIQPIPFNKQNREYHCMQSARKQLLMSRSKYKFPERE